MKKRKQSNKGDTATPGDRVLKRGGLQLPFKNGKAVWKYFPVRTGVRKASQEEMDEVMRQLRQRVSLPITINGPRKKRA